MKKKIPEYSLEPDFWGSPLGSIAKITIVIAILAAIILPIKSCVDKESAAMNAKADCVDKVLLGHKPLRKIAVRTGGEGRVGVFSSYFIFGDKISFSFFSEGQYYMASLPISQIRVIIDDKIKQPWIEIDAWGYRESGYWICDDTGFLFEHFVNHITVHCQEKDFAKQIDLNL